MVTKWSDRLKRNNKKAGTDFENAFVQILSEQGFWVHKMQDNRNGQPFDVIAAKQGCTYVFDCKDCKNDTFPLSRIEENQYNAMSLWQQCGNQEGLFVMNTSKGIRILSLEILEFLKDRNIKTVNKNDLLWYSTPLSEWLEGLSGSNY